MESESDRLCGFGVLDFKIEVHQLVEFKSFDAAERHPHAVAKK